MRKAIAPNDSAGRFSALGVHVIKAEARFKDKRTVIAGDVEIRARRFVIATGSSARSSAVSVTQSATWRTEAAETSEIGEPSGNAAC